MVRTLLSIGAPTKAEKQKRYWEAEEARLLAEEAELDRMEKDFGKFYVLVIY